MELLKKTAVEQHKALINKEVSALELTQASIKRIEELDKTLGAFNSLTVESALKTAKEVDDKKVEGSFRAHQVPIDMSGDDHLDLLEAWLRSYHPEELFDENGKTLQEIMEQFLIIYFNEAL